MSANKTEFLDRKLLEQWPALVGGQVAHALRPVEKGRFLAVWPVDVIAWSSGDEAISMFL